MTEQIVKSSTSYLSNEVLLEIWQRHTIAEFVNKNPEEALETMTKDPYVLCVPINKGGIGLEGVRHFYTNEFIPQNPADLQLTSISITTGQNRLIDESLATFTHNIRMDWMFPGIEATGKRVEIVVIAKVQFSEDGKISHEHVYWDHASALKQLGLIDNKALTIAGPEAGRRALELATQSR